MAIPWVVWLAVGAAVALWSLKLGAKFTLFFYAGLVFVAIGLVKMVISLLTRSPEHTAKHQAHPTHTPQVQHHPVQGRYASHVQQHGPPAHPSLDAQHATAQRYQQQAQVFACPRCHAPVNHMDYFCSQCGMRIR